MQHKAGADGKNKKVDADEKNKKDDEFNDRHPDDESDGSHPPPPQEKIAVSPSYSARKMRREARMRGQRGVASGVDEGKLATWKAGVNAVQSEAAEPKRESAPAAPSSVMEEGLVTTHVNMASDIRREAVVPMSAAAVMEANDKQMTRNIDGDHGTMVSRGEWPEEAMVTAVGMSEEENFIGTLNIGAMKDMQPEVEAAPNDKEQNKFSTNVDAMIAVQSAARSRRSETEHAPALSATERKQVTKNIDAVNVQLKSEPRSDATALTAMETPVSTDDVSVNAAEVALAARKNSGSFDQVRRPVTRYRSHGARLKPGNTELEESRNEYDSARNNSSNGHSFSTLMDKWKHVDDMNRQTVI